MADEQELVIKISAKNLTKEGFAEARAAISGIRQDSEKAKPATKSFFESIRDGEGPTKNAKAALGELTGTVGKFAAGFTIASIVEKGAGALFGFGQEVIANAGRILNLSKETGLSTDAIQRFDAVASKTDSTMEAWTTSVYKLGLALAGGDQSVKRGLDKLGLSYDEVRRKSPEQQFVLVAGKLRAMTDETERNLLGAQLFGKGWKDIAAGVVDGHLEMAKATNVASREQLQAINDTEQAWKDLKHEIKSTLTTFIGEWALARRTVGQLTAEQQAHYQALVKGGGDAKGFLKSIGQELTWASQRTSAFGKDMRLGGTEAKTYGTQLKEAGQKLAGLTESTRAEILAAVKLGEEEEEVFRRFDINKGVLALLKDEQEKHTAAVKEATRRANDRREALERIRASEVRVTDAQRASILELRKREVAETDIALALGVTAAQIKQVVEADEKATKAAAAAVEERAKRAALSNERAKENTATYLKLAQDKAVKEIELLGLVMEAERAAELQGTHGVQRRLIEINQAEKAELGSLATKYDASSAMYTRAETLITERYQHERDLANGTASTIQERMRAQGIFTRDNMRQTADDFRRDYEQMRQDGSYTAEQLRAAWNKWYEADESARGSWSASWLGTLDRLGSLFQQAAEIGGESFGNIARWIGTAVSASRMATEGARDFRKGVVAIGDDEVVEGAMKLAAGIISVVSALDQATSSGNTFQRTISGAMVGAQGGAGIGEAIGGMFGPMGGPIGKVIGAVGGGIIGGLVGLFRSDPVKDTMKQVGRDFGVKISEGLAKEINELAKKVSGPTEKARKDLAALLSLDKIIAEGGGANKGNIARYGKEALVLFDVIKRGGKDGAAAVGILNNVFGQLEPIAAKTGHVADASLLQIIQRARDAGESISGIDAFVDQHLSSAQGHLGRFLSATGSLFSQDWRQAVGGAIRGVVDNDMPALTDSVAEWNRKVALLSDEQRMTFRSLMDSVKADIQQGFEDAGIITETTFAAMRAGGKGLLETVRSIGPSLDDLIAAQEKLGLTGTDTFSKLLRWREIVKNNEPLIEQVDSMNGLMLGLGNAIGVNQAGFDAFGRTAVNQFERLVAAGATGEEALEAMAPSIQTLIELQDRFGFKVDDATQKLIDEAKASGFVGDEHKSASERMVDGINRVVERMDAMLEGFGIRLPRAISEGVGEAERRLRDGLGGAIADIDRDIKIHVGVEIDEFALDYEYDDQGFIKGGRTRTVRSYASGGIAVGRQMAIIGDTPSGKEIVGDIPFMTRALTGALERLGSQPAGGGGGAPPAIYVAVDPSTGTARQMGEAERSRIQNWLYAGQLQVPQQFVSGRGR